MDGACFVAAASACFLPTTSIKSKLESLQNIRIVSINLAKVHFNLHSYFIHKRLNINGSIFFCTKNKEIDFEENKFNERFGECSDFYIKRPINVESHMYKVTN